MARARVTIVRTGTDGATSVVARLTVEVTGAVEATSCALAAAEAVALAEIARLGGAVVA